MIHQMLHGYKRGHQLLASSTDRLNTADQDTVLTLSDLSGILPSHTEFRPYLTSYPLLSSKLYVIARTWLDESAERDGCVLTHSLLVDFDQWKILRNPYGLSNCFVKPNTQNLQIFENPILFSDSSRMRLPAVPETTIGFTTAFFKENTTPVLWFDAAEPETIFWNFITHAWPELRIRFSCCTFSLNERNLDSKSLNLLFAPTEAYSRFKRYSKKHFLLRNANHRFSTGEETWIKSWDDYLFRNSHSTIMDSELIKFLGSSPTDIQTFFAFEKSLDGAEKSPMLLLGAMDILESIAPQLGQAVELKNFLVSRALELPELETNTNLEFLKLLTNRLSKECYGKVMQTERELVAQKIIQITMRNLDLALMHFNEQNFDALYEHAMLQALEQLAKTQPQLLIGLISHPQKAAAIIPRSSAISAALLKTLRNNSNTREIHQVIEWLLFDEDTNFSALLEQLAPTLVEESDIPLLTILMSKATVNDLGYLMHLIENSEINAPLPIVFSKVLSARYPKEIRKLASKNLSHGIALAVALTYETNSNGLSELLKSAPQVDTILIYLDSCLEHGHLPIWLRKEIQETPQILETLLTSSLQRPEKELDSLLYNLLNDIDSLPIGQMPQIIENIDCFEKKLYYCALQEAAAISLTRQFISDEISASNYQMHLGRFWLKSYLARCNTSILIDLINRSEQQSSQHYLKLWNWLSLISQCFVDQLFSPLPKLIQNILEIPHDEKTQSEVVPIWQQLLESAVLGTSSNQLDLYAQCLQYCMERREVNHSVLMITTFDFVHSRTLDGALDHAYWANAILKIIGWDKAAVLRENAINAFRKAEWPSSDFVLMAKSPELLRKLAFRMKRKWTKTDKYFRDALNEIVTKNVLPENSALLLELREIVKNPDWKEDWF